MFPHFSNVFWNVFFCCWNSGRSSLKSCFLPSLPPRCHMIRALCKQVWRTTAYLDLSSTDRAAFIELLRSFLSTFLQYLPRLPPSHILPDIIHILPFLIISLDLQDMISSHSFCDDWAQFYWQLLLIGTEMMTWGSWSHAISFITSKLR